MSKAWVLVLVVAGCATVPPRELRHDTCADRPGMRRLSCEMIERWRAPSPLPGDNHAEKEE